MSNFEKVLSQLLVPFTIITGYRDQYTKLASVWRLNIMCEKPDPKKDRWWVTIQDDAVKDPLVTFQLDGLQSEDFGAISTPLQRLQAGAAGKTCWEYLLDQEEDSGPTFFEITDSK